MLRKIILPILFFEMLGSSSVEDRIRCGDSGWVTIVRECPDGTEWCGPGSENSLFKVVCGDPWGCHKGWCYRGMELEPQKD